MTSLATIGTSVLLALGLASSQLAPEDIVSLKCQQYEAGEFEEQILRTLKCESNFENKQSNIYHDGVREESYGVAQINLPHHPEISKEQALNIEWSIDWTVKEFKAGRSWQWSCFKKYYGKKSSKNNLGLQSSGKTG